MSRRRLRPDRAPSAAARGSRPARGSRARRGSFNDGSAGKIACPVLVCEATDDLFYSTTEESDPRKLYRHLTAPKTLLSFTEEEGGDAHCHPGALRLAVARIFDWLDDTI
ncbi:hypothetical protein [Streptomyces sp. S1A1-7]|uniref:hypothetical protein n=1 Tax=Streptomyces sp. S1A1-7 TaxID=2594459 RepID=UPI001F086FBE|nr:hypothetical protein [Streptomyces sp. S1A1-7]